MTSAPRRPRNGAGSQSDEKAKHGMKRNRKGKAGMRESEVRNSTASSAFRVPTSALLRLAQGTLTTLRQAPLPPSLRHYGGTEGGVGSGLPRASNGDDDA